MDPQAEELREKGNACMKEEKYIEAMFHYTHGVKIEPQNPYLYSNRSVAFLRMQQYHLALQDAVTTIRLLPKWSKGYYRKAEVECVAEHYKEAIESYKQGLLVHPNEPGLTKGLEKATSLYQVQQRAESRMPWYGLAMGCLIGILLIVFDEGIASKPVFQNDVVRSMVLGSLIGICYLFAILYRYFVRSQRAGLLESPPDLMGDGFGQFLESRPASKGSAMPVNQDKSAKGKPAAMAAAAAPKSAYQRKKTNR